MNRSYLNYLNIFMGVCLLGCLTSEIVSAQPIYYRRLIPEGYWSYYERSFNTRVVYERYGNNMKGRMGDICFEAFIGRNGVRVNWWGNVPSSLRNYYSVADFTADNVDFSRIRRDYYQEKMWYCQ